MTHTIGDGSNGYPINQYARVHKDTLEEFFKAVEVAAHAKRLALELECVLLNPTEFWGSAHEALSAYQAAVDRLYPQEHVSPLGKD